jgi:hypothetical protein
MSRTTVFIGVAVVSGIVLSSLLKVLFDRSARSTAPADFGAFRLMMTDRPNVRPGTAGLKSLLVVHAGSDGGVPCAVVFQ